MWRGRLNPLSRQLCDIFPPKEEQTALTVFVDTGSNVLLALWPDQPVHHAAMIWNDTNMYIIQTKYPGGSMISECLVTFLSGCQRTP